MELAFNPKGPEEGFLFWASWVNHAGASIFSTQDAHGPIRRGLVVAFLALKILGYPAALDAWKGAISHETVSWSGIPVDVYGSPQSESPILLENEIAVLRNLSDKHHPAKTINATWPLSEGDFDGETIVCANHSWEFDAKSGCGVNPADCALSRYPCMVNNDGTICVDVT